MVSLLREGTFRFSEVRFSFLAAPILFFASSDFILRHYTKILAAFLIGIYAYILYALLYGIYFYLVNDTIVFELNYYLKYVLYNYLPGAIHHTYVGMYLVFGSIIILFGTKLNTPKKIILVSPLLLAVAFIGSKFSVLIVFLTFLVWACISLYKRHKKSLFALVFLLVGLFYFGFSKSDLFRTLSNSFDQRIEIFRCSYEGIKENWLLGIGKEQVKPLINDCTSNSLEMDTHNMYLQELLSFGIIAFTLMMAVLLLLYLKSNKNLLLGLFLSTFMLFGLVEHLFNMQLGVTYFVFFALVLFLKAREEKRFEQNDDTQLKANI
ncbi:MAG: hypothetical protein Mars2KO_12840 [Maribacter sp.]